MIFPALTGPHHAVCQLRNGLREKSTQSTLLHAFQICWTRLTGLRWFVRIGLVEHRISWLVLIQGRYFTRVHANQTLADLTEIRCVISLAIVNSGNHEHHSTPYIDAFTQTQPAPLIKAACTSLRRPRFSQAPYSVDLLV